MDADTHTNEALLLDIARLKAHALETGDLETHGLCIRALCGHEPSVERCRVRVAEAVRAGLIGEGT